MTPLRHISSLCLFCAVIAVFDSSQWHGANILAFMPCLCCDALSPQVYGSNPDSIRSHNGCQALLASPKLGSLQCVLHNGQAADVKGTKAFVQQIGHGSAKNVPYSDSANIFAFDHASEGCPEPASAPSGVVILYANPMAAGVSDVHKALQSTVLPC